MKTITEKQRNTSGNNGSNSTGLGELMESITTLPWKVEEMDKSFYVASRTSDWIFDKKDLLAHIQPSFQPSGKPSNLDKANARYIAHACNSLPALVEALEDLLVEFQAKVDYLEPSEDERMAIEKARSISDKAKTIET